MTPLLHYCVLTTAIDLDDGTASLDLAMSVVGYFELAEDDARVIRSRSRAGGGNVA